MPLSGFDNSAEIALLDSSRQLGYLQKSIFRFQIALPLRNLSGRGLQANSGVWKCLRCTDTDTCLTHRNLETEGYIMIRFVCGANLSDRVPILTERFRFSGREKRKIRLVIRIDASHQFDVRGAFIRDVAVPRITKRVVAPSPLLLPWRNVMIGHKNQSGFMFVIVPTLEVFA